MRSSDLARIRGAVSAASRMATSANELNPAILRHIAPLFHAEIAAVNFAKLAARQVQAIARSRTGPVPDTDGPMSALIHQHPVLMHIKDTGDVDPHYIGEFGTYRSWT